MKQPWIGTMSPLSKDPKHQSILYMGVASALHFAGYELARSATLAMMTSHRSGFQSASAVSFATGCVSPFSIFLLWLYTHMLDRTGPRSSLQKTTWMSALLLATAGTLLNFIDKHVEKSEIYHHISKAVLFSLFIIQNGFVYLLCTQHWSFLSSVESEKEGAVWFAPIAGLGSIASTLAGLSVSHLVKVVGLPSLLLVASVFLLCAELCSDAAYRIAEANDFVPKEKKEALQEHLGQSLWQRARCLFRRVPVLGMLALEVLSCQCLSSLLSFLFVWSLKEAIHDDKERARHTGNAYAWINFASGVLQFGLLPLLVKRMSKSFWLVMPTIMFAASLFIAFSRDQTVWKVAVAFSMQKTLEYSLRGVLGEMVYVSLDYESRFVGKEIMSLFVNRLGKSTMAISLGILTASMESMDLTPLRQVLVAVALVWIFFSYRLVKLLSASTAKSKVE